MYSESGRRIVAAGHPHRTAVAFFVRHVVPCVAAGLAVFRNRREAPGFAARLRVERDDVVAAGRAAGGARDDLAFGDRDAAGEAVPLLRPRWPVPRDAARLRLERDDVRVGGAGVDLVAVDRNRRA